MIEGPKWTGKTTTAEQQAKSVVKMQDPDKASEYLATASIKRLIQEHNKTEKQVPLREPDLMIVMTGGQMAYIRPDGVKVIPLACLKD